MEINSKEFSGTMRGFRVFIITKTEISTRDLGMTTSSMERDVSNCLTDSNMRGSFKMEKSMVMGFTDGAMGKFTEVTF